ncbi:hypothetical protein [Ideonella sp. BN130291]|uniref:hypothetical protein n=1 Tax=Ideonella sp. BN130291 TaxID=3112940 RepID=UPI002E25E88E|nr:hypothetical protein [Ideonella sp. BN130291]
MMRFVHLSLAALLAWHGCIAAVELVRYPVRETAGDRRYDYPRKLLELALSKSGGDYRVVDASVRMNQERQVLELEAGRTIDVGPIPTSAERERRLLPVRIPLNRGLLGWRIGLIRKGEQGHFSHIARQADLASIRIAQGAEWPDTKILQGNGIQVKTGSTYPGLFEMLADGRFDYFPRSVMEIWDEQQVHRDKLDIEQRVALHYFYDSYFFVSPRNVKLAEHIRKGLEAAIADQSFERLFLEYWGDHVRRARLQERVVIELRNPLLTPETPAERKELWFDPVRGR